MEEGLNELALFAGAGGGLLASRLLGWRTVCAVELDDYARGVLLRRQNDGALEPFPVWDDVCTFDGHPWRGRVDVVSGGFPCQDISVAGKGGGIVGKHSGLWRQMFRIVREVRPSFVFVENSPLITSRGLDRVLGDLASAGFDAEWGVLSAADVGAPHLRKRFWCVAADPNRAELRHAQQRAEEGRQHVPARGLAEPEHDGAPRFVGATDRGLWASEPNVGRVAYGVAARVDRLQAVGNGQVPLVAACAWRQLRSRFVG